MLAQIQEKLVQERRKTEMAEENLEQIRFDRKQMESQLEKLRNILQYGIATEPQVTQPSDSTQVEKPLKDVADKDKQE